MKLKTWQLITLIVLGACACMSVAAVALIAVGSILPPSASATPLPTVAPTVTPIPTFTALPTATETPPPTLEIPQRLPATEIPPCSCAPPDLDCANFPDHAQAQACFDHCARLGLGDVYLLDLDLDGNACEPDP